MSYRHDGWTGEAAGAGAGDTGLGDTRHPEQRRSLEGLLAEAEATPVEGWDFEWFDGRASEQRPSWGYARLVVDKLEACSAVVDIQTGGGEVLAEALEKAATPGCRLVVATESWPPNVALARSRLAPFAARVAEVADDSDLPFSAGQFDLVVSRHPTTVIWPEIARVMRPGGIYFFQQIGAGYYRELTDFMMAPNPFRTGAAPNRRRPRPKLLASRSSTCAPRAPRFASTTSARWRTSCAKCSGRSAASP